MTRANIELHIEALVLHGLALGDRQRTAEAVERELARLFAELSVPSSLTRDAESARLDAGAFDIVPGSDVQSVGTRVAQAIYQGLIR
jgi:hypothetical protein